MSFLLNQWEENIDFYKKTNQIINFFLFFWLFLWYFPWFLFSKICRYSNQIKLDLDPNQKKKAGLSSYFEKKGKINEGINNKIHK